MLVDKRIEKMVEQYLIPPGAKGKITALPSFGSFTAENCLNYVLSKWPFSECIVCQVMRGISGEVWMSAQTFAKVGTSFRPVVLIESVEDCSTMSQNDLIHMISAVVEEIETELESLRQEGVILAACEDLLTNN
ncbi:hypothetical protein [Effusibacillus lacus]|uniref:Uncharacterized protein n=1 Tax=Effusibacillus lacus TaxID=1348429 RepID=A0A292YN77_9BACL|nr:hypothetical protein [Effusibacillus lacus]TCS71400.1 hypothetical protein EDD64_12618 [Effusibacillus lacus]GAX89930.1 hypothetical protein EFBL_1556 [Effusibacillus lacus]